MPNPSHQPDTTPISDPKALPDYQDLCTELAHSQRLAALGTVAGIIAHEFNNLMTPVISYTQMALDNPEDAQLARRALRRALDASTKAAQVSDCILGFAEQDLGSSRSQASPLGFTQDRQCVADIGKGVAAALSCMARDPAKDGIDLVVKIPDGLTAAIRPIALQQVVLNVVLNARKAMLGRGGRLRIQAWQTDTAPVPPIGSVGGQRSTWNIDRFVVLLIEDTGLGMTPEQLSSLFRPFSRRSASETHEPKPPNDAGHGLGLSICRRLVDSCGGDMWIVSKHGIGTAVTMVLKCSY